MKSMNKGIVSAIVFLLCCMPMLAYSQDQNDQNQDNATSGSSAERRMVPQPEDKNIHGNLTVSGSMGVGTGYPTQKLEVHGYIKGTEGLCIGDDCRKKWPSLKCAQYDNRPAEETGDSYCQGLNKACFGVFLGSGASYFNECSTPPGSTHSTRCCWVE